MPKDIIIYHGSERFIRNPEYGRGNIHNDFGQGFYCTEKADMAKEWACNDSHGGYANKYKLNTEGLKILDLSSSDYSILHWVAILLKNRLFTLDSEMITDAKEYILHNFNIDTSGYDIIKGYRADDSYFTYANDFLHNSITVTHLNEAVKSGDSGLQIVLVSQRAFEQIRFMGFEEAPKDIYLPIRKKHDELVRIAYLSGEKDVGKHINGTFMIDIMRNEMKANDPRLQ